MCSPSWPALEAQHRESSLHQLEWSITYRIPQVGSSSAWSSVYSQASLQLWSVQQSCLEPSWRRERVHNRKQESHLCLQTSRLSLRSTTKFSSSRCKTWTFSCWLVNRIRLEWIQDRTCAMRMSATLSKATRKAATQSASGIEPRGLSCSQSSRSLLRYSSRHWLLSPGLSKQNTVDVSLSEIISSVSKF